MALLLSGMAHGEIRLPHLFSDHAVLQRDRPLRIWGWASPGARLSIHLHDQDAKAVADSLGQWDTTLMPEEAGGPYTLSVEGDGHVELTDVMLGDVWLASGQSNMEIPLSGFGPKTPIKYGAAEIAAANHPDLRLLLEERDSAQYPVEDIKGVWTHCTPETAAKFSAVAYFFGRDLAAQEHVTIGVIDASWGGTPADPWISMNTLGSDAQLLPAFAARATFADTQAEVALQATQEKHADALALKAGQPAPAHAWVAPQESWIPSALYNGMIAPLTRYALRGFIWYQGETNSNADRADFYATLFPALIQDWRMHFAQGNLPFLFVEVTGAESDTQHLGIIRDAQRRTLFESQTAMAVAVDLGSRTTVHPPDKQTVGYRLMLAARAVAYGEKVQYQSPLLREVTPEPGALRVWFDHADGLTTRGEPLAGFEIAGADHRFVPAKAELQGETVVVSSPAIAAPRYVRYLWQNFPPAPLYNNAGLPASTFSNEDFPRIEP